MGTGRYGIISLKYKVLLFYLHQQLLYSRPAFTLDSKAFKNMTLQKRIARLLLATAGLLLVPLVAMQFTKEVAWTQLDFATMGLLVFGAGLAYELVARPGSTGAYRVAAGLALATAFLLVWLNLAVGLIGTEHNFANLLYGGVLATGAGGALLAHCRARGMAYALFATALAQVAVPGLVLLSWPTLLASANEARTIAGVTGLFVVLWVGAGLLFWRASTPRPSHN